MDATHYDIPVPHHLLEAEINFVINPDNSEFIQAYRGLILDVIYSSAERIKHFSSSEVLRLYAELVDELALCYALATKQDSVPIAGVYVGLKLQQRLYDVLGESRPRRMRHPLPIMTYRSLDSKSSPLLN